MFQDSINNLVVSTVNSIFDINIELPSVINGQQSDFQFNGCFKIAKILKTKTMDVAKAIMDSMIENNNVIFKDITISEPGFINFNLNDSQYVDSLQSQSYFKPFLSKKVLIDFGGPNIAKPLHVGHLRSFVIGESLSRILKYAGADVTSDIHLGDWGLQMGQVVSEILLSNHMPSSMDELQVIYPKASKDCKDNAERMAYAKQVTSYIQDKKMPYYDIWKSIHNMSIEYMKPTIQALDVHFDLFLGESDCHDDIINMEKLLMDKNLIEINDGAMIVDIKQKGDKKELPPFIFRKSDKSVLYGTTDLTTLKLRVEAYHPDEIIYVADKRQELHFEQLFRVAKKAGYDCNTIHVGFGTVNDKSGKPFKTRNGGTQSLMSLIQESQEVFLSSIMNKDLTEDEKKEISYIVSIGSIKFFDLMNKVETGYVYDIEKILSMTGKSGPYIMYSVVRAKSILGNAAKVPNTEIVLSLDEEKELIKLMDSFPLVMKQAVEDLQPSVVADYTYNMAKSFSKFYDNCRINSETDMNKKMTRLMVCEKFVKIMEQATQLLGIALPHKM